MKRTLLLAASAAVLAAPSIAQDLPPGNPLPGECFARVIVPAQYTTSTEQIVLRPAGEEIKTIPGRFETVTERVLVQEESYELVTVGSGGGVLPGRGAIQVTIGSTTYSIDSSGNVSDGPGNRVGAVDNSGNIVANDGSVIAANAVDPLTFIGTGSNTTSVRIGSTTYRVASDRSVRDSSGNRIGTVDRSGNIVGTSGSVVSRNAFNSYRAGAGQKS